MAMAELGNLSRGIVNYLGVAWSVRRTCVSFIPFFVYGFWSLLATKLRKYSIIFVYILQGKMCKMEKTRKENHATKVTKIPKTEETNAGQPVWVTILLYFNLKNKMKIQELQKYFLEKIMCTKLHFRPLCSHRNHIRNY
jgi:hypothetical protein